jgi:hypothetical protein
MGLLMKTLKKFLQIIGFAKAPRDGDGDGKIFDGTVFEQKADCCTSEEKAPAKKPAAKKAPAKPAAKKPAAKKAAPKKKAK